MKLVALVLALVTLSACGTAPQAGSAVNQNCVLMAEHGIDPEVTTAWQGKTLGFCCDKCKTEFEAMDDAGKAAALAKAGVK